MSLPVVLAQNISPTSGKSSPARPQNVSSAAAGRAFLDRYCSKCHNERLKTAGLVLDQGDMEHLGANPEMWEKVVRKLRAGAMPPAGLPRPEEAEYDSFATYLEDGLDHEWIAHPNAGYPAAVHRLNRAEYANVIRDLLALDVDASTLLPADDSGYGFDNIGDVLSMSPSLMERYLSAARKISQLAVGDISMRPATEVYKLLEAPVLMQNDRMSEDLPFGTRGGLAVRHHFALDGEYLLKVRLQRTRDGRGEIRGLAEEQSLDARIDGARIKTFTVGRTLGSLPPPDNLLPGGLASEDRDRWEYEIHADDEMEVRFPAKAGPHLVQVAFEARNILPEGGRKYQLPAWGFAVNRGGNPDVDRISIVGPFNATGLGDTESRRRVFICRPISVADEDVCATKILSRLARRAFRRTSTDEDLLTLMDFYRTGRSKATFDAGIAAALRRILIDPNFLFRIERPPKNSTRAGANPIGDFELASRLSFFLWSSIPDDTLLDLAATGQLNRPSVLTAQIRRMMADSRSQALITNFTGQWLYLRNLRTIAPDPIAFPEFDENLREAFRQETELFVTSMFTEDRSILDLLSADYTFLNERLANHYQVPNVYGSHFRRVQLVDGQRRGILGQGSILTATSYATRTSPTVRGKWLLENIFGAPPPPPPPNVPSLKESGVDGKPKSVREAMEQHRSNPVCAGCHARMDPLGFALENFNGVGRWRTTSEANAPIDDSALLPDGTKFRGPAGLRNVLISHSREFVQTVTEKLLTYSLGRGLEYYDAPAVRKIVRDAAASGYRWSSLITGIVNSAPFQLRDATPPVRSGYRQTEPKKDAL